MQKETAAERKEKVLSDKKNIIAPEWNFIDLTENSVSLASMKGEVVVLDFWATWCGPCKMTLPRLIDLNNKYKNSKDVNLISMNVWERVATEERHFHVQKFAYDEGMVWPVLLAENSIADEYEVRGIPTFVVIDKDGVIRYTLVGYESFLDETLGWMIESLR